MKKYFILATAAAVALASCSKVVMDETPDQEINFVAMNHTTATKANDGDGNHIRFYQDGTFKVIGLFSAGRWTSLAATTDYMGKKSTTFVDISKQTVADGVEAWKSETSYFWPKAGKMSFIGYYPSTASGEVIATTSPVSNDAADTETTGMTIKFENYTVAGTISAQAENKKIDNLVKDEDRNDLMIATPIYNQTENVTTDAHDANGTTLKHGVSMVFNHKLAKVEFKAQLKNYNDPTLNAIYAQLGAQINQIEIRNIDNKATFDGAAWGTPTNTEDEKVSSGNFVNNTAVVNGGDLPTAETGLLVNTTATTQGPEYYVLPQSLSADTKVVYVNYTVYTTAGGKVVDAVDKKATVALKLMDKSNDSTPDYVSSWDMNKRYIYTIIIDPFADEIYFDPAVVDWDTEINAHYEIK